MPWPLAHARCCLLALAVSLGLLACTTTVPPAPPPQGQPEAAPATTVVPLPMPEPAEPPRRTPNAAVQALLEQAAVQRDRGDFASASSLLERALRIAPQEPAAYQALAALRLQQHRPHEAGQLLLKAANLPGLLPEERAALWRGVADCREQQGDAAGAAEARLRAGTD